LDTVTFHFQWVPEMVMEVTPVQGYTSIVLGDGNAIGTGGGQRGDSVFTLTQATTVVPVLTGNIVVISTPLCNDSDEGALEVAYGGGLPPISIQWSTGANTALIQNLPAGLYSATVTDMAGQQLMFSQQLNAPDALGATTVVTDPACHNTLDGTITLNVQGGTPPYMYFLNGEAASNPMMNLGPGNYNLSVVDANGCVFDAAAMLEAPEEVVIDLIDVVPQTTLMGGAIVIELMGGTLPYDFFWEGPDDYTGTIQNPFNLEAGNYSLTVTDANGCTKEFTVEVGFASGVRDLSQGYHMQVSPNPGASTIYILPPTGLSETWQAKVLTPDGRMIFNTLIPATHEGSYTIDQQWRPGVYMIGLYGQTSGVVLMEKWVKIAN